MAIVTQKALAECQIGAFVLSYKVFGNPLAEPCIIWRWLATSSVIACRLFRIKTQTSLMFSSVQDVNGCPDLSSLVTPVQPFLKMVSHSYILLFSKSLFPYCAETLWLISSCGTPSANTNLVNASSLVLMKSKVAMLTLLWQYYSCLLRSQLLQSNAEGSRLYQHAQ